MEGKKGRPMLNNLNNKIIKIRHKIFENNQINKHHSEQKKVRYWVWFDLAQ